MHLAGTGGGGGRGGRLEFKLLQGALHVLEFYVCTFIKVINVCLFSLRLVGSKTFVTLQCVRELVREKKLGFK